MKKTIILIRMIRESRMHWLPLCTSASFERDVEMPEMLHMGKPTVSACRAT